MKIRIRRANMIKRNPKKTKRRPKKKRKKALTK